MSSAPPPLKRARASASDDAAEEEEEDPDTKIARLEAELADADREKTVLALLIHRYENTGQRHYEWHIHARGCYWVDKESDEYVAKEECEACDHGYDPDYDGDGRYRVHVLNAHIDVPVGGEVGVAGKLAELVDDEFAADTVPGEARDSLHEWVEARAWMPSPGQEWRRGERYSPPWEWHDEDDEYDFSVYVVQVRGMMHTRTFFKRDGY